MTNKKEVFNKKELIGEKVHCAIFGNGIISLIDEDNEDEPCEVDFNGVLNWYSSDGCLSIIPYSNQTLSFGHKEDVEFDYGVPSVKTGDERLKTYSFGKVVLSFNNPDDGQLVCAIRSDLTIKEHGDSSIDEKTLVLKGWLDEKGVDTGLFWKNCKKKHNLFNKKRRSLIEGYAYYWIEHAFLWDGNLLGLSYEEMSWLSVEWMNEVDAAVNNNNDVQIELGF